MLAARVIVAIPDTKVFLSAHAIMRTPSHSAPRSHRPHAVAVISQRANGYTPATQFSLLCGTTALPPRFIPGTFTNQVPRPSLHSNAHFPEHHLHFKSQFQSSTNTRHPSQQHHPHPSPHQCSCRRPSATTSARSCSSPPTRAPTTKRFERRLLRASRVRARMPRRAIALGLDVCLLQL